MYISRCMVGSCFFLHCIQRSGLKMQSISSCCSCRKYLWDKNHNTGGDMCLFFQLDAILSKGVAM